MTDPIVLDFETKAIQPGAPLLPEPVGCAILDPEEYPEGHYFAWGHPEGNNCTKEEFGAYLKRNWHRRILTQNGATFDIPVAEHHFNLPPRDPLLTDDTLFASYLHDPHAPSLSLKDLAHQWLGIPPDEQQEMYDWIMANVPDCKSRKDCGAYISETPVRLSGPYAIGDCTRTLALWNFVKDKIKEMTEPYHRELTLAPILADIQNTGMRVELKRLLEDYLVAIRKQGELTALIRERLNAPTLNPSSDAELGVALKEAGYTGFLKTATGKDSMNKLSLDLVLENDPELRSMLKSRSTYETLTGTFMWPWIQYAKENGGRIHAGYNQVRNPEGFGTRTGRLSSSKPNFQNVPNNLGLDYWGDPFPEMRSYLLPEEGHVWVCGDFKNQEPRLAAHFEDGAFCRAFNEDPLLDPYLFLCDVAGMEHSRRKTAKGIYLGLLYAMGVAKLADKLDISESEASVLRNIIKASIPDIVALDNECKRRFRRGLPIRTLGGRYYFCEPGSGGRTWDYKALNTLIQGSAADQTKEAIIYIYNQIQVRAPGARILGSVHDEVSVSCLPQYVEEVKEIFREAANALPCDVPMLFDFGVGNTWAEAA